MNDSFGPFLRIATGAAAAWCLVTLSQAGPIRAADMRADDERIIRDLVRGEESGRPVKRTNDNIFSSGRTPKPLVGLEEQKKYQPRLAELDQQRPNAKRSNHIQRIVISKSGDLAYEYSNFRIEFDGADGKRTGFNGSYLRVWHKIDGQWQQEAFFARPHEEEAG